MYRKGKRVRSFGFDINMIRNGHMMGTRTRDAMGRGVKSNESVCVCARVCVCRGHSVSFANRYFIA